MWLGYGDNMRVLKWIVERLEGSANAGQTVLGAMPKFANIDRAGLSYSQASYKTLTEIDASHWQQELPLHGQLLAKLGIDCRTYCSNGIDF